MPRWKPHKLDVAIKMIGVYVSREIDTMQYMEPGTALYDTNRAVKSCRAALRILKRARAEDRRGK
jgi:hypothetical protein